MTRRNVHEKLEKLVPCGRRPGGQDGGPDRGSHHRSSAVLGDVDWIMVASASALAGILSLLTSVAGLPELKTETEEK